MGMDLAIVLDDRVSYAMHANGVDAVISAEARNGPEPVRDAVFRLRSDPPFIEEAVVRIDTVEAGETVDLTALKGFHAAVDGPQVLPMTERCPCKVFLERLDPEGEILESASCEVQVLPFNEWSGCGRPEEIASFVTPNSQSVPSIDSSASDILGSWNESPSLEGYQSGDRGRVMTIAAAIFAAFEKLNINYINPPAGFESKGQRIRLTDEVVSNRNGTCIDLAVAYASALESVGLNPLIFFINGHAMAGLWLEDEVCAEVVSFDSAMFTRRIRNRQIAAVECTMMANNSRNGFEFACEAALRRLEDSESFICAVDVKRARATISPLPVRLTKSGEWTVVREKRKAATTAPKPVGEVYEAVDGKPLTRVDRWKRELLDITSNNAMINMRKGTRAVPLLIGDIGKFEDSFSDGNEFEIFPKPQDWNGMDAFLDRPFETENYIGNYSNGSRDDLSRCRIRTPMADAETESSVRSVFRLAKKEMEESGCNSLFLALGILRWFEGPATGSPRYAPLILIPAELRKRQKSYSVAKLDEETVFNVTLAEKLKQDFDLDVPNLDPLPTDDMGVNVDMVLQTVRRCISSKEGWEVLEGAAVGVFSFSQFAMWKDLGTNMDSFVENKLVKSLVDGLPYPAERDLVQSADPYRLCLTVPADGSQIKAVSAAKAGNTFVMHGPPGTGKSQTITNMICDALYDGRTVLFVAEKKAALEVVQKRLEASGVGPHCLELHSNKSEKTKVLDQLRRAVDRSSPVNRERARENLDGIERIRTKLDVYVSELHRTRSFGLSAFECISGYETVDGGTAARIPIGKGFPARIGEAVLIEMEDDIRNACRAYSVVKDVAESGALNGIGICGASASVRVDAEDAIADINRAEERLDERARDFSSLGVPADARDREARRRAVELILSMPEDMARDPFLRDVPSDSRKAASAARSLMSAVSSIDVLAAQADRAEECLRSAEELRRMLDRLADAGHIDRNMPLTQIADSIARACRALADLSPKMASVYTQWRKGVFEMDREYRVGPEWASANSKGLFAKSKAKKDYVMAVSPCLLDPYIKFESLSQTASTASEISSKVLSAVEEFKRIRGLNGEAEAGCRVLEDTAARAEKAMGSMSQLNLDRSALESLLQKRMRIESAENALSTAEDAWDAAVRNLKDFLRIDRQLTSPYVCRKFCESIEPHLGDLFDWSNWNVYAGRLRSQGLASALDLIAAGTPDDEVVRSVQASAYAMLIDRCRQESEPLRMFNSETFEDWIKRFKRLDKGYSEVNVRALSAKLALRVPGNLDASVSGTEASVLYKAINSSRMGKSIRKLISEMPNMLPRICPCMLMSPQSVSQYLTMDFPKFDLVIFDESSQITTCKAIGALGRSRNAVVAGDSRQLPPTSFFQRRIEADEEEDLIDVDSFLDDCLSLNMPQTYLEWHYRSRHESLIAFSNRMFYEGRMLTFPSPDDRETKVRLRPVKGVYERGRSINPVEASAVVDEIVRRVKDPVLHERSIGVIAFGIKQQTCIQDMLDDRVKNDSKLFAALNSMKEEVFIKNLESVQGDERDIILFSIGYGPGSDGGVYQNFGPINREGGGRRLNVAVSRARMEMHVFSSMSYTDIKLTASSSKGVRCMREFLRFAENDGRFPSSEEACFASSEAVMEGVAEVLEDAGYETRFSVGTSSFKVDVAVVDPDDPGRYVLGILGDGDCYRSSENTRDREYARSDVLEMLGWNLMHVWSMDWHYDREGASRRVLDRVASLVEERRAKRAEEAERGSDAPEPAAPEPVEEPQEPEPAAEETEPPATEPRAERHTRRRDYVPFVPEAVDIDADTAVTEESIIRSVTDEVVKMESPINEAYLLKIYCKAVGISRLTEKKRQELVPRLRSAYRCTEELGEVVYWNGPDNLRGTYRASDDPALNRPIECVPRIEILNACLDTVETSGSVARDMAATAVARAMGYKRAGAKITSVVEEVLEKAVEDGLIREGNGRLTAE